MLAKWWKKILLAVCIIACIFNIMSKLVNRHSLKENLESANDGVTVFSFFQKKEVEVTEKEEVIDNVMSANYSEQTSEEENVVEENTEVTNAQLENTTVENTEQTSETTESDTTENVTQNAEQTDNKTYKYKDFLTNLFNF